MKFRTSLELFGKTATGIVVPDDVVAGLQAGKRPPVSVTINGFTYRTTVSPMSGCFLIPVSAERREKAGIKASDSIEVGIELDTEPRTVEIPADLAKALKSNPAAAASFEKLSYTHRKEHVLALESAKTPETRSRRLEKTIASLTDNTRPA
ncbi:MAG TPA: YdeI/OmpD-associated family protein [Fimbriimonadales bacterium]|nr:YdeI/OmpD-associated family protein [Fimbriimonadales bacterium]